MLRKFEARRTQQFIFAGIISVLVFSFMPSAHAGALSLRDITDSLFGVNRQTNQTPPAVNQPAPQAEEPIVAQQPQPTPAPITPQAPSQATTSQQPTNTQLQAANNRVAQNTPASVDTSAAVLNTASQQSTTSSAAAGSPYVSNKLDPQIANNLLLAGAITILAGMMIYGATTLPVFKKRNKLAKHIPVKSL